ncbi:MAG: hypothetical protein QXZ28_05630 [Candidatus Methanomethylicaceae archaeon]
MASRMASRMGTLLVELSSYFLTSACCILCSKFDTHHVERLVMAAAKKAKKTERSSKESGSAKGSKERREKAVQTRTRIMESATSRIRALLDAVTPTKPIHEIMQKPTEEDGESDKVDLTKKEDVDLKALTKKARRGTVVVDPRRPVQLSPEEQLAVIFDSRGRIREDGIYYRRNVDPLELPNELLAVEYLRRRIAETTGTELRSIIAHFAGHEFPIDGLDSTIKKRLKKVTRLCFDLIEEILESKQTPSRVKYKLVMDFLNYFYPQAQELRLTGSGEDGAVVIHQVLDPSMREQVVRIATNVALAMAKSEGKVIDVSTQNEEDHVKGDAESSP